jgi:hypothetical protein
MARSKKPKKGPAPAARGSTHLYTLDVQLIGGPVTDVFIDKNPVVSRTIQIRGDQTLEDLHFAIFDAFERDEEHMYEFQFGKKPMDRGARRYTMSGPFLDEEPGAGAVEDTTIDSLGLEARGKFYYWFDFGDDWWHQITVKAVEDQVPPGKYPKVTEKVGESPPQYPDYDEDDEEAE